MYMYIYKGHMTLMWRVSDVSVDSHVALQMVGECACYLEGI